MPRASHCPRLQQHPPPSRAGLPRARLAHEHANVAKVHPQHVLHLVCHLKGEALPNRDNPVRVVLLVHLRAHERRWR